MQLVINNFGAYLRKHNDMFLIMIDEKNIEVPVIKVDNIWISTSALVSTDAIQCAMKNNIDIVFLDKYGDPYARIWHPNLGSTPLIRRRQLEASTSDKGLDLVTGTSIFFPSIMIRNMSLCFLRYAPKLFITSCVFIPPK